MMKRLAALFPVLLLSSVVFAVSIPAKPSEMVNDFAAVFSEGERAALEETLRRYHDQTSTQIFVVTVPSLDGRESLAYATELGNKWGAGQAGKNNGVVILVKPKTAGEYGDVAIALGDGITPLISQTAAQKIMDSVLIPMFKRELYADGIRQAVSMIDLLLKDSFAPDSRSTGTAGSGRDSGFPGKSLNGKTFLIVALVVYAGLLLFLVATGHSGVAWSILRTTFLVLAALAALAAIFGGRRSGRGGGGGFSGGGASGKW